MSRVMTNKIIPPPPTEDEPPLFEVGDVIVYEYIEADGDWRWALASVEGLLSPTVLDVTAWEPIYTSDNRFLTPMSTGSRDTSDIATSWRKLSSDIGSDESFGSDESNVAQYLILHSSVVCSVRRYNQILVDANVHTAHGEWDGAFSTATEGIDYITLRRDEVDTIRSALHGHNGASKEHIEQLKTSLKTMTARCSTAEAERHALAIRSNKLEKAMVNSTCTEAHLHVQLSDVKNQVKTLQEDLELERERIQPIMQDSSSEVDECQQQSAPPSHLDTFGPVLAEVHGPCQSDLYDHVAALEAIAADAQHKEHLHKQALASMDGALQKALVDIQRLTDSLNAKEAAGQTNKDLERRIAEIQVDYDDSEAHITTLQTRTSELELQLAAAKAAAEKDQFDAKAHAADIESQLAAAKAIAEKDQSDASDAKAHAADLESQLAAAKAAAEKDQSDASDAKARIEEVEDALLDLMNEREGRAKSTSGDKDKIDKLSKALSELQTRHDTLEEHHVVLEGNYDTLNRAYNLVAGNKWTRNSQKR